MSGLQIPTQILRAQYQASQPDASSWVSANAGAGKTYVLAQRVIRLLMQGVAPQQILCLTYTKAAAAEMKRRIAKILGAWTQLDDASLKSALQNMDPAIKVVSAKLLNRARALFALSVETPGGLNVQTFHGFCERILHQFPLEAGIPVQFSLGDEQMLNQWKKQALAQLLFEAQAGENEALGEAYELLVGALGVHQLEPFIFGAMRDFSALQTENVPAYLAELAHFLELEDAQDALDIEKELIASPFLPISEWPSVAATLEQGGKNDAKLSQQLLALHQVISTEGAHWVPEQVFDVFLKKSDHRAPKKSVSKAIEKEHPDLAHRMAQEALRLEALAQTHQQAQAYDHTKALIEMAVAANERFKRQKQLHSVLDFDDLIEKMRDLVAKADQVSWVHYKIDQGIDHILIDEAQDTSPPQWHIIQSLVQAFFEPDGEMDHRQRTLFAVGDQKQSIYSFQGARPELFTRMQHHFLARSERGQKPFLKVPMQHSFRSLPPIMEAVDKVFARPDAHHDLSGELGPPVHKAVRQDGAGHVEIWPLVTPQAAPKPEGWVSALPAHPTPDPHQQLAHQIASQIAEWLRCGRQIADRDKPGATRAIEPGDIMILVQRRNALFEAILTQLGDQGVPTAGADRLVLQDHIFVNDLVALGKILLLPQDDLSLAVVLKSPLFGLDEQELFELCHGREGTVWQALEQRAKENARYTKIYETLLSWRNRVDIEKPFDLYSQILAADGVRARYVARFLSEAEDVCAEFLQLCLAYEADQVPSLAGFIHWVSAGKREIKREFDQGGVVRVMTVHGAKGLEAPIVFLADAARVPRAEKTGLKALKLPEETDFNTPALYGWVRGHAANLTPIAASLQADAARQDAEYRRLLYVAITRAENELYICGTINKGQTEASPKSWYGLIVEAFEEDAERVAREAGGDEILCWPKALKRDWQKDLEASNEQTERSQSAKTPDWLITPASKPSSPPDPLSATQLIGADHETSPNLEPIKDIFSDLDRKQAIEAGNLMHMLLQYLPDIAAPNLKQAAETLLASSEFDAPIKQALCEQAIALVTRDDLSAIFGPQSRAEVPFRVRLMKDGVPQPFHGVIDRLVVSDDEVLILDFKSTAYVPKSAADIPDAYKMQLSLYKLAMSRLFEGKQIKTALLYTRVGSVIQIEESQLAAFNSLFTLA